MTIQSRIELKSPSLTLLRRAAYAPVSYLDLSATDKKRAQGLLARELVEIRDHYLFATAVGREVVS